MRKAFMWCRRRFLCLIWSLLPIFIGVLFAEGVGPRRLAFVVGNNAYPLAPLRNAVNDAVAISNVLKDHGFTVQRSTDVTLTALDHAIDQFLSGLHPGDTIVIYYSGHGMQIDGENYMIP